MVIRPFKEEPPPPSFIRWSVTQKKGESNRIEKHDDGHMGWS